MSADSNVWNHLKPMLYCLDVKVCGWFTLFHTDLRRPSKECQHVPIITNSCRPWISGCRQNIESLIPGQRKKLQIWAPYGHVRAVPTSASMHFDVLNQLTSTYINLYQLTIHSEALLSLKSKNRPLREEHGLLTPATPLAVTPCIVESDFFLVPGIVWCP